MKKTVIEWFLHLVSIDTPSSEEGPLRTLITRVCDQEKLRYICDDFGNIFVWVNCIERPKITFACHLDTVPIAVNVKPIVDEVCIRSDGTTALGADNKIAVALALTLLQNRQKLNSFGLLFTVEEEVGLQGVKHLSEEIYAQLDCVFAFDSSKPVGSIVVQAPWKETLTLTFHGKASHAGTTPEMGISAISLASMAIANMKLLRVDVQTTANIGSIHGDGSTNVVCDLVTAAMEIRSLDEERVALHYEHVRRCCFDACAAMGGTFTIARERSYPGYCITSSAARDHFRVACSSISILYREEKSGGGSDVNILRSRGIDAVLLGAGYVGAHSKEEAIAIDEIARMALIAEKMISLPSAEL